jgi:hypothetical protein
MSFETAEVWPRDLKSVANQLAGLPVLFIYFYAVRGSVSPCIYLLGRFRFPSPTPALLDLKTQKLASVQKPFNGRRAPLRNPHIGEPLQIRAQTGAALAARHSVRYLFDRPKGGRQQRGGCRDPHVGPALFCSLFDGFLAI